MIRLGKFTGTIYNEDYDFSKCPECCVCVSDNQANNKALIAERHEKDLLDCIQCMGCPAASGMK